MTNLLAPPLDQNGAKELSTESNATGAAQTLSTTVKSNRPEMSTTCTPPSYQDAVCGEVSLEPPPYIEDDPESATSDSVGSSEQGEILFSMESVQVSGVVSGILSSC